MDVQTAGRVRGIVFVSKHALERFRRRVRRSGTNGEIAADVKGSRELSVRECVRRGRAVSGLIRWYEGQEALYAVADSRCGKGVVVVTVVPKE